ncbi:S-layer homology domain-containing protein [Cohnella sp. WQ 127256]|uniref:S-layer homology domain-containing protein n=1 Tax=Cohnella sp. WQ 127256 TaxID=2938790 RepID=UPI0021180332|nr:S-layer homology domain-containing protein [Cohnella sp. WQ 127256]
MLKRMISLSLLFCMLVSIVPSELWAAEAASGQVSPNSASAANGSAEQQPLQNTFKDVKLTDWFYNAVTYVQQNGIFGGTGNDSFSPDGTMTRAMYVTVLGRMAGVDVSKYTMSKFADVQADAWYAPYVQWAVEKGITSGMGNHKFAPDTAITREQMATLTLRFFEVYNIPYQTNASLTSKPNDLSNISPWAVDAIVKLWQAGLLAGDANGNFNPRTIATRAEAATFAMRSNEVVKAGVNSDQVGPTTQPSTPAATGQNPGSGGSGPGTTTPVTYKITFESNGGSVLDSLSINQGEKLNILPTPFKKGFIFVDWYKDSALSTPVDREATVNSNLTLYAKYEPISNETQIIPSVSMLDQNKNFTIRVTDATGSMTADQVKAGLIFESLTNTEFATRVGIQVTGSNGQFTVGANGGAFDEGDTYQLKLNNTNLTFTGQDKSTTTYVFTIAKQAVQNVQLNPDLIYIPVSPNMKMGSVPVVNLDAGAGGAVQPAASTTEGTFQYDGTLRIGSTVAIYDGIAPNLRNLGTNADDDGEVSYVTIRAIDGNTYTYGPADARNVLFTPDILPVSSTADTDGDPSNHSITVSVNVMDYSDSKYARLGLSANTVVQANDFITFYTGVLGDASSTLAGYAQITGITSSGGNYVITYIDTTLAEITTSMDYYNKQNIGGDQLLANTNVDALETQIEEQALASGFVNKATEYLAALALDTDSFKELDSDFDLQSYHLTYADGSPVSDDDVKLMSGNRVEVENLSVVAEIDTELKHFEGMSGLRAALQVGCEIVIDAGEESNIVIKLTGTFEQEVRIDFSADANDVWDWWGIFPYLSEYEVSPTIDTYTYTAIQFDAKIGTFEKEEEPDWADKSKVQNIATELKALMDAAEDLEDNLDGIDSIDSSLPALYQNMLETESDWVDIFDKELYKVDQRFLMGIVQVTFEAKFVVSANVNLSVGSIFSYENAKRYIFNVKVFAKEVTTQTVNLVEEKYEFTFYIMGTLGLRAGLRLEIAVGILSTDLNSIGFVADVGAYVKLWGYFYYQLKYTASQGKTSKYAGAMLVEIGVFVEVKFKAQLLKGTFSYEPTLFEKEWPLFTAGSQKNVLDFAYSQADAPQLNMRGSLKEDYVPWSMFKVRVMDLKTGEVTEEVLNRTKDYIVSLSNNEFMYDLTTNKAVVKGTDSYGAAAILTISWKNADLTIGSAPISRTISLRWDVFPGNKNMYLYDNDGWGKTLYKTITGKYNDPIQAPVMKRDGYQFLGWARGGDYNSIGTLPDKMPAYDSWYVAAWKQRLDIPYKVEIYLENSTDNGYTRGDVFTYTDNRNPPNYVGFNTPATQYPVYKEDGSTVIKYYYTRKVYLLRFIFAYGKEMQYSLKYGAPITAPTYYVPGFIWDHWVEPSTYEPTVTLATTMPAKEMAYKAKYTLDPHWPVTVEYYKGDRSGSNFQLVDTKTEYGTAFSPFSLGTLDAQWSSPYLRLTTPSSLMIDPTKDNRLKLIFVPYLFNLTFDANGGTGGTESQLSYGDPIIAPTVTRPGFTFQGWSQLVPSTMPGQDQTFQAVWQATSYKVLYYQQNLNDDGFTQVESVTGSGGIGSIATAAPKDYTGFTYDSSNPDNVTSGTVTADGTLTLKLYYTRNSYTLSFVDSMEGINYSTMQVKYGAPIVPPADAAPSDFYPPGFVLITWDPVESDTPSLELPDGATMPAHDASYSARFGFPGGGLGL